MYKKRIYTCKCYILKPIYKQRDQTTKVGNSNIVLDLEGLVLVLTPTPSNNVKIQYTDFIEL